MNTQNPRPDLPIAPEQLLFSKVNLLTQALAGKSPAEEIQVIKQEKVKMTIFMVTVTGDAKTALQDYLQAVNQMTDDPTVPLQKLDALKAVLEPIFNRERPQKQ